MQQLALSQRELSEKVERIHAPPRESEGSNATVQMSMMQEAITSLAEVMKAQAAPKPISHQAMAKDEATTLAALAKAASTFDGKPEAYYQFRHGMENFLSRRALTD